MKKFILLLLLFSLFTGLFAADSGKGKGVPEIDLNEVPAFSDSVLALGKMARVDSLFYSADSIRAYYEEEQIWLFGDTSIDYGSSNIMADSLFLDLKKEKAYSMGPTRMRDGDQLLIGEDVSYDIKTQKGLLKKGLSFIENGFYSGEEIRKIGNNVYDIDGGSFTTCDLAEPSYWFWAKAMRIYQKDKVVGKHVLAYVNHLPIFYFPFVTMSIKRGRHPGFLIPEPGYNTTEGKYVKDITYYYPYKDYADLSAGIDLTEKRGWKAKLRTNYLKRYEYSGSFNADYQKYISSSGVNHDWSLRATHHHDLQEKSSLDVSLDFISNKRIWEGSNLVDESLAQRLYSSIAYRKPLGNTYLNAGVLYNQDLINDQASISLPSASWSVSARPLYELLKLKPSGWYSNLSYHYNVRLEHSGDIRQKGAGFMDYIWANKEDEQGGANPVEHHFGIKHSAGLSNSYNYRGWLNLRQSIDYNEAWYDRDKKGAKPVRGNDYSASLHGSFNLYGLRQFDKGRLKAVRHVLTPTLGMSYVPDHSENLNFYNFGAISLRQNKKQANLNFSLAQKWQLKYISDKKESKLNDFFTWDTRLAYDMYKKEKQFSNIGHSFGFRPGSVNLGSISNELWKLGDMKLSYQNKLSFSQKTYEISFKDPALGEQYFSQNLEFSGKTAYANYFPDKKNRTFDGFGQKREDTQPGFSDDSFSFGIMHDMTAPKSIFQPKSQNLRMNASLKLTKNYSLSYSNYYDLKNSELIAQSIRVTRDLHCWKLDFSFTKRNEYWDYRIVFFNTQFPDALRFQTRDSKKY